MFLQVFAKLQAFFFSAVLFKVVPFYDNASIFSVDVECVATGPQHHDRAIGQIGMVRKTMRVRMKLARMRSAGTHPSKSYSTVRARAVSAALYRLTKPNQRREHEMRRLLPRWTASDAWCSTCWLSRRRRWRPTSLPSPALRPRTSPSACARIRGALTLTRRARDYDESVITTSAFARDYDAACTPRCFLF